MLKNLVRLECDVCSNNVTVDATVPESAEQTSGWIALKRQEGKVAEEFLVCSGGCLSKMATMIMEQALKGK